MHRIPPKNRDLRRYVFKKAARRLILLLLWTAVWLGGALAYNQNHSNYPPERLMLGWRLALLLIIMLAVGCLLFRVWKIFTERTVSGTVVRSGITHTYTPGEDPDSTLGANYDFRLKTALLLRSQKGKKIRVRFDQKTGTYLYYREGESLVRLHGLPYPINVDPNAPHGYVCAACGRHYGTWHNVCEGCGMSLIDPKDLQISK